MSGTGQEGWLTVPEVAERLHLKVTQVHRLIEDHWLLASRHEGVTRVPEEFLGEGEPLRELRGTVILLLDAGFSEADALEWLLNQEDSLGVRPIEALRAGRKTEVRRVAQALAL